jgi:hypothetical protein
MRTAGKIMTISGTAVGDMDYNLLAGQLGGIVSGSVMIPCGSDTAIIPVYPYAGAMLGGTVTLTLTSASAESGMYTIDSARRQRHGHNYRLLAVAKRGA